jgi:diaminopimelate epimerase
MLFSKGHGLGNDYLVVESTSIPDHLLTRSAIVQLCDRNCGVGADGILLLEASSRADFGLRIFNPDGSEAEKSGNGLRIAAKYLWDHGRAKSPVFTVETLGGIVPCECRLDNSGNVLSVAVEMGRATFRRADIPMDGEGETVGARFTLPDGVDLIATALSVGNPHCVVFCDDLDAAEVRRIGPMLEAHPIFPNRTNVQFARVQKPDGLEIMIWERGAGWTLASGSSSCAAVAAAVRNGFCNFGRIQVTMPGGELVVTVRPDWSLLLEGPAEEIYEGTLAEEFAAKLASEPKAPRQTRH